MLHSIVITNEQGCLLLSRYYGGGSEAWDSEGATIRAAWERRLWGVASPWPASNGVGMIDESAVVWRHFGAFVVFASGDDEYDELILSDEVIPLVNAIIFEHCEKKPTEAAFLKSDTYGKIITSLEELFRAGHLFHSNVDAVLKMSKLKKIGV